MNIHEVFEDSSLFKIHLFVLVVVALLFCRQIRAPAVEAFVFSRHFRAPAVVAFVVRPLVASVAPKFPLE